MSDFRTSRFTSSLQELPRYDKQIITAQNHRWYPIYFLQTFNFYHVIYLNATFILGKFWSKLPEQASIFLFSVVSFLGWISSYSDSGPWKFFTIAVSDWSQSNRVIENKPQSYASSQPITPTNHRRATNQYRWEMRTVNIWTRYMNPAAF